MPRKAKEQVKEIEDSDNESVSSIDNTDHSDHSDHSDNSDNESVASDSSEDIEVSETKPVSKKAVSKSKKETVKKSTAKSTAKTTKSTKSESKEDEFDLVKVFEEFDERVKEFTKIEESFVSLQATVKDETKKFKESYKSLKKGYNELQAKIAKEHKKLSKGKPRAIGNKKKGGFTKATPVPMKICKYLGLEVDTELPRSEVTSKCFAEFKKRELGLGNREYKFDKETAKVFGKKKGDKFHLHAFQGLLAELYNESKTSTKEDL